MSRRIRRTLLSTRCIYHVSFHCIWHLFTQRGSVAKSIGCLQRRLSVCQHDNFRISKHRMMTLGGRWIVQKSRPSSNLGVIVPLVRTPFPNENVTLGYDVGKISAGCLVSSVIGLSAALHHCLSVCGWQPSRLRLFSQVHRCFLTFLHLSSSICSFIVDFLTDQSCHVTGQSKLLPVIAKYCVKYCLSHKICYNRNYSHPLLTS